jgi:hypothetical protein
MAAVADGQGLPVAGEGQHVHRSRACDLANRPASGGRPHLDASFSRGLRHGNKAAIATDRDGPVAGVLRIYDQRLAARLPSLRVPDDDLGPERTWARPALREQLAAVIAESRRRKCPGRTWQQVNQPFSLEIPDLQATANRLARLLDRGNGQPPAVGADRGTEEDVVLVVQNGHAAVAGCGPDDRAGAVRRRSREGSAIRREDRRFEPGVHAVQKAGE